MLIHSQNVANTKQGEQQPSGKHIKPSNLNCVSDCKIILSRNVQSWTRKFYSM